eukprot:168564-Amphidinium_carterae.2
MSSASSTAMAVRTRSRSQPRQQRRAYEQSFEFASELLQTLVERRSQTSVFEAALPKNIVLITDYSGIGCAEMALGLVSRAFAKRNAGVACGPCFSVYRSNDLNPHCRCVLVNHADRSRPQHVQGNMQERVKQSVLERMRQKFSKLTDEVSGAGGRMSSVDKDAVKALGREFLDACMQILKEPGCWNDCVHCYVCGKDCPVYPPEMQEVLLAGCHPDSGVPEPHIQIYVNMLRSFCPPSEANPSGTMVIACGGNTCVPWSSRGKQKGWLECETTMNFAIWMSGLLAQQHPPDIIVQECTRNFDVTGFTNCIAARYEVQRAMFSPVDLGFPVHRSRSYTLSFRKDRYSSIVPLSELESLAFRAMRADARMYLRAPGSMIVDAALQLRSRRRKDADSESALQKHTDVMTDATKKRWQELVETAKAAGLEFALADVTQHVSFHGALSTNMPCFTTTSELWVTNVADGWEAGRPICSYELLGALGWPVLLPGEHELSDVLPYTLRFAVLQAGENMNMKSLQSFVGNGMHVSQVVAMFLWALFGVNCHGPEEVP